jgi:hypothetical protein
MAVTKFNLTPTEFWNMTFADFWAIFDFIFEPVEKEKFDVAEYERLEREWLSGNVRRTSHTTNSRNKRS